MMTIREAAGQILEARKWVDSKGGHTGTVEVSVETLGKWYDDVMVAAAEAALVKATGDSPTSPSEIWEEGYWEGYRRGMRKAPVG